jgi:hypothetical protein
MPRRVGSVGALLAFVLLASAACGEARIAPAAPTGCPDVIAWRPAGLPAPPDGVVVAVEGTRVRARNALGVPAVISLTVFTPGDCDRGLGSPMPATLEPGTEASWEGTWPRPAAGPVLGGVAVWLDRSCAGECDGPPDAYLEVVLPPGS